MRPSNRRQSTRATRGWTTSKAVVGPRAASGQSREVSARCKACLTAEQERQASAGRYSRSTSARFAAAQPEKVFGVPHRRNFILGLGSNETISGGAGDDQIRAFGANVTIRGGRGDDLVYGGPSGTLIGGRGHDLLIESGADATVGITGKHTEVVASGHNDRILRSSGSGRDVIYAAAGTAIDSNCQRSMIESCR
jgi:hypothetical protein